MASVLISIICEVKFHINSLNKCWYCIYKFVVLLLNFGNVKRERRNSLSLNT